MVSVGKNLSETIMAFSILVCTKAVPDLTTGEPLTVDGTVIVRKNHLWCLNPYDAHALEAALSIRDAHGATVDALSVGDETARPVIRRAMAMGADTGIHIAMSPEDCHCAATVAQAIADVANRKKYDLILTGAISQDLMQGITGPLVAAVLDWPCATAAVDIVLDMAQRTLTVVSELEGGMTQRFLLALPALVTVQTGGRQPRYPSLSNTLRARRQTLLEVDVPKTAPDWGGLHRTNLAAPQPISNCKIIEGTPEEKADRLLKIFDAKGWLK